MGFTGDGAEGRSRGVGEVSEGVPVDACAVGKEGDDGIRVDRGLGRGGR